MGYSPWDRRELDTTERLSMSMGLEIWGWGSCFPVDGQEQALETSENRPKRRRQEAGSYLGAELPGQRG